MDPAGPLARALLIERCQPGTRARRIVKCGWNAAEFWRVGPGKSGGFGQNRNKAPSTYEVEGALSAAPFEVGQLPGLPCTAGRPPVPATRNRSRLPGLSHVPGVSSEWCPFPAVK
jgi:hypothetical protein